MTNPIVRVGNFLLTNNCHRKIVGRFLSHYPIDDNLFGLNEEQIQVRNHKNV